MGDPPQGNVKVIKEFFGGDRFTIFEGDSTITLPNFVANSSSPFCDLMSVDGGHFDDVPWQDLSNFAKHTAKEPNREHVVVYDDTYMYVEFTGCCPGKTYGYEKGVRLGMFDTDVSYCKAYECGHH